LSNAVSALVVTHVLLPSLDKSCRSVANRWFSLNNGSKPPVAGFS